MHRPVKLVQPHLQTGQGISKSYKLFNPAHVDFCQGTVGNISVCAEMTHLLSEEFGSRKAELNFDKHLPVEMNVSATGRPSSP